MTGRTTGGARRAPGEGSIYQDDQGRWHGWVSMGSTDHGRRDRRHRTAKTRRDLVVKMRQLEAQRDAGTAAAAGQAPTLGVWLEHWLETIAVRCVRASTLTRYRMIVTHQLTPKLGHYRLDRLRPEHIDRAWAELAAAGLAPATVLQAHRVLSRALNVAEQRGKVGRNVARLVDAPTVPRAEVEPLSQAEALAVLDVAARRRNAPRWAFALVLGLRQGEVLGLCWQDVDLERGSVTVRRALQRQAGAGLVLVEPKSRAGRRVLALPDVLVDQLRAHRATQRTDRMLAGPTWKDQGFVFTTPTGQPLDPRGDHRSWRQLLDDAGVRQARLHDARHTAATLMLELGVPARVAMEVLGHSRIGLTLDTYSHVGVELARDAIDRVAAVLWDKAPPGGGGTAGPAATPAGRVVQLPHRHEGPRS